ncbi:hypothetical protein D3C75_531390 [compost metagenome]
MKAPPPLSSSASHKNSWRIWWLSAPSALSRPISPVRWRVLMSARFIIMMPETSRLMAPMPATARVRVARMVEKVASMASRLTRVTSSTP